MCLNSPYHVNVGSQTINFLCLPDDPNQIPFSMTVINNEKKRRENFVK